MKSVGQGTIEYLVIMAIIIVIGLLFVGVTSSFLNTGSGISGSINKVNYPALKYGASNVC